LLSDLGLLVCLFQRGEVWWSGAEDIQRLECELPLLDEDGVPGRTSAHLCFKSHDPGPQIVYVGPQVGGWRSKPPPLAGLPTMLPRTGPSGVANFFVTVGQLEFRDFQILDMVGGERQVAVEVAIAYLTPAGALLSDEEVHLWTFNADQQVVRMRHYVDTAKHIAAFTPMP
jgi:hypothetical protein